MRSKNLVLALIVAIMLTLTIGSLSVSASGGCQKHYVQYGETLYSIGRVYRVDPYAIAAYNGISNPDYVKGGTWICLPYGPPYPGGYYYGYQPYPRMHYVQHGETLYSLGRLYNVDPYAIAKANYLYDPDYVKAGMKLYIPYGPPYPGYYHGYGHPVAYGYGYDSPHYGCCYRCYDGGYPEPYGRA